MRNIVASPRAPPYATLCGDIYPLYKMAEKSNGKKGDPLNQQKVLETLQQLRIDQRNIATKMSEIDSERAEHV